jgi:hypothetical protein
MPAHPDLRASDDDRERTVEALRHHASVGRLTVDELDERTAKAYAARWVHELAELHADLPGEPEPPPSLAPARRRRRPWLPGRMSFHTRWHSPAGAQATMRELLADVAPPMAGWGYEITQRRDGRLRFERETRPPWTYPVAIFLFPFGLLALLYKDQERITIDLDELDDGTTQLVVIGTAPLAVRRAFAELQD